MALADGFEDGEVAIRLVAGGTRDGQGVGGVFGHGDAEVVALDFSVAAAGAAVEDFAILEVDMSGEVFAEFLR